MRNGKLFETLDEKGLESKLKRFHVTKDVRDEIIHCLTSPLEEAASEFPYRPLEVNEDPLQELLKLHRDRHNWFVKWFGVLLEG